MTKNRQIVLASRPKGEVKQENFRVEEVEVPKAQNDGEIVAHVLYCSVDPYMRGRMNDSITSYVPPFALDKPISGYLTAQVTESKSSEYQVGDIVTGVFPFAEYIVINTNNKDVPVYKVHEALKSGKIPLSYSLGALGMPGMTAHIGLLHLGKPKSGETVLVSAAAGAVGSLVGQIAKIKGCKVVGIAGSDDKVNLVTQKFGFDDCFNYKTTSYLDGVTSKCPEGVDVYFDNVGGDALDAAIMKLRKFGRIVLCGAISQYNDEKPPMGPRLSPLLVGKAGRMEGFIVGYYRELFPQASDDMAKWIVEGKLKLEETVVEGIENVPKAFIDMMAGKNTGKMLIKTGERSD